MQCSVAFVCAAQPDLQLTLTHSPQPVSQGELLTAALVVTNAGGGSATSVNLVVTLSPNATFFSANLSQGTFTQSASTVTCSLGSLAAHAAANVSVVVTPGAVGLLTNSAAVTEAETDANPADNVATHASLVVPATFYAGPCLNIGRSHHTATTLPGGRILFAGGNGANGVLASAEVYDPQTKAFTLTVDMTAARTDHAATLLLDGTVLITGGLGAPFGWLHNSAEIYNPTNGTFTAISNMVARHAQHTATRLADGRVLIAGTSYPNGSADSGPANAELYVPVLHGFTNTGTMKAGGGGQRAFVLTDGKVALLNGIAYGQYVSTSDLYDPAAGTFTSLGYPQFPRFFAGAAQLLDGRILLAGGSWYVYPPYSTSSEIFNPGTLTFSTNAAMRSAHPYANATRLLDGTVLITGADPAPELFDPVANTFSHVAGLAQARAFHTGSLLADGSVLIVGGLAGTNLASTELYDPARTKPPPAVSIADNAVAEGNLGLTNLVFSLTLSSPMGLPVSVDFATADGSAVAGLDFVATNGTVLFAPGVTNRTIAVAVIGNFNYEWDKSFQVNLSNPTNAAIDLSQATGTILNDDSKPTISVPPVTVLEGNAYTNTTTFSLTLSAASVESISVDFFTSDGTALAGADYFATNGTITFDPGVTNRTLTITITSDILPEPDKVFYLNLTNAINASIAATPISATILNDDGVTGVVEHFELSTVPSPQHLQVPIPLTITAKDTLGQTATNFSGGVTLWATLTNVPWLEFGFEESDFSQWTPLNLGNSPGPYQIVPFDVAGHGYASRAFRLAANAGAPDGISRPVTLQAGTTYFLAVDLAAMNENGGFANTDPSTAHLQINGQEIGTFSFGVFGWIYQLQTFRTNLTASYTAPSNGVYQLSLRFDRSGGQADVWSYADNLRISATALKPIWLAPFTNGVWSGNLALNFLASGLSLLVEDVEGHQGSGNAFDIQPAANLSLQVTNSPALPRAGSDITFTLLLTNRGPASAANVTVTNILAGDVVIRSATNSFGTAAIFGNTVIYSVNTLTNGRLVTLTVTAKPHALGWFTNTASATADTFDPDVANNSVTTVLLADLPLLHVDSPAVTEGNAGTNNATVPVWLEGPVSHTLSLDYATTNGTATGGLDYLAVSGTAVFPPDTTTQYIQVPIIGDLIDEPNETVTLLLSNAVNAVLAQAQATLTITDDDPLPIVSIADASLLEGNSGTTTAVFQVTLANPSSSEVRITCSTSNGTATNGTDYTATTTTLIFPVGTTNQTFSVPVIGDVNNEPDQTFFVTLSAPVNCTIGRSPATGTIINDDAAPGRLLLFTFGPITSPEYRARSFPLTIRARDNWDNPATGFSGYATLTAQCDAFYIRRLLDDFEDGDLVGWTNYSGGTMVASNVNDVAATGSRSLRLTGKAPNPFYSYSLRYTITNSRPNKVSFSVRAAQTNAICGRMWAVGGAGYRAFDFYMSSKGQIGLNANTGFNGVPYVSNRWYKVDLDLDWTARKVNCSVDGTLAITNVSFLDDPYSGTDWIAVQNTDASTSWFDDIHVYNSYATNLAVTPTTVGPFSSATGLWTGTVTISQASSNAYFSITDNNDHSGKSALFDVLTANLSVLTPVAITEGSTPVVGQVTIPAAFSQSLVVGLTSSVPAELTVPASVTIAAGQTNATFNLTVINDALLDGSQLVTVSAGNTNLTTGSSVVSVDDNETTTITLTLPASAMENVGTMVNQGRVTLAAAPAKAVAVKLSSSDTNTLQVPATVTVSAGQTTATFNLTVVDNPRIDGNKSVTVAATVANWTNDSKTITIVDNEDTVLRLSGPAQLSEEMGSANYTLRISGTLTTNLDLALSSSNTNALVVPSTVVTIPAGATNVIFTATILDNTLFDGAKVVQLTGSAPGFTSVTNTVTVLDNEIHHLGFSAISGTKTSSVPFSVTVSARDILDGPATALNSPVTLTASGPAGPCIVQPANITLANGSWSGSVTLYSTDTQATLQALATNGLAGQSTGISLAPLALFNASVAGGDLAYSAVSQRVWALVGADSTLVPIDPFRSLVEPAVSAGNGASHILTSGDGRYLHIVGNSGLAVRRFDTLSRTIDLSWTNSGLSVEDIAAQPGNPNIVAVSWACPGCSPRGRGVFLYEGGVMRTNGFGVNTIEFGDSPDRLYGYNNDVYGRSFHLGRVNASGVVDEAVVPILGGWTEEFTCGGGIVFSRYGPAYDPETGVLLTGSSAGWTAPADKAAGRFFTVGYYTIGPVTAYDLATSLPVGTVNVPGPYTVSALIRWGTNGLAFCSNSKVVLMRTSLLPTAPAADLAVTAAATNIYVLSSNSVHCLLNVANAGPSPATNAVLALLLPANVTLTSAACSSGLVQSQSANSLVCTVTNLPVGGQATIDLTLLAGLPGMGNARISLTGDNVDLNRANNFLSVTFQVGYSTAQDSVTEIHQPTSDLAWNSNAARIVMAVPNVPLNTGSSLLLLDPLTGRFDPPIPTGQSPSRLSVHPAGRYVYASLDGETAITRVDLANRVADLKFTTPHPASDLAVKPDDPAVVATTVSSYPQVLVYRNGTLLPNTVDPTPMLWNYCVEFSSIAPTLLYCAYPEGGLRRIRVDTNGATLLEDIGGLISGWDLDMRCDGGLVFTAGGRIFDPEIKTNIATVPYGGLVAPDANGVRGFYLNGSGTNYNLVCLNFTNQQLVGSIAFTNISGSPTSLIRWGTDGLAFRTTGGQVFVVRTTMADDRNQNGLADSWELEHFHSLNAPGGGPNDDPDHDGFTNLQEQQAGLDPLVFDALRFREFGLRPDGAIQLAVIGHAGDSYALMASTNLADWTALQKFTCTNPPTILLDPSSTNFGQRFYRLAPVSALPRPSLGFPPGGFSGTNNVRLVLEGVPGVTYRVESATNLLDWVPLNTFLSTNSLMYLEDAPALSTARKFYRAVAP